MPQPPKYVLPDVSSSSHNVGRNIATLRKKRGLRQKELAEKIGISPNLLSHYENGRLSVPVDIVIQIAISLKVHTDAVLGLEPPAASDDLVPSPRILQRLRLIEKLPAFDQKSLLKTIDNALKGAGVEPPEAPST